MFERVKKGVKRIQTNVSKAKAKSRGMSLQEYRDEQSDLRKTKLSEEKKYRNWKIEQDYKRKRKSYKGSGGSGALDAITGMGRNVLKNVDSTPTGNFNRALTGEKPKSKKRKRKKRKVVVYV